jgi:HSP20 family protein
MLTRWFDADSFPEATSLRSMMDRLLEQAVVRPGSFPTTAHGGLTPPINVAEQDSRYVVQVYVPGIKPEDVELSVRQNTLTIKGHWGEPALGTDGASGRPVSWLLQEFGRGEFTRSLTVPKAVDSAQVEADYEAGILTITLPLATHEQARPITIRRRDATTRDTRTVDGSTNKRQPQLQTSGDH